MEESRASRVARMHEAEQREWGFHARDRKGPWILRVDRPVQYLSHLRGDHFDSKWFQLDRDGTVTIKASVEAPYAWDGCTPKYVIGKRQFILGTPDGYKDTDMEFPITWKASLIHDAFYQYLHVIPIEKREIDRIFLNILRESRFVLG